MIMNDEFAKKVEDMSDDQLLRSICRIKFLKDDPNIDDKDKKFLNKRFHKLICEITSRGLQYVG